ncbi:MAG TPA: hypothetical protein VJK26_02430 [Patescibacteria group bacterium]|nr:hypothetical protein [Patescibacteria group bacterium]
MAQMDSSPATVADRVIPADLASDLFATACSILSIPRISTDALVVFPGLVGEYWRVWDAIIHWEVGREARHFLIAGEYPHTDYREKDLIGLEIENLKKPPFRLKRTKGVHIQPFAENTKVQAEWACELLARLGALSVILFASPFHLVRCYLTLLKVWQERNLEPIIIVPSPTIVSPGTIIPEMAADSWALFPGEVWRINDYQEKGWIASLRELKDYLEWLYEKIGAD